jgi:uncharacterized membrane protein
VHIQVDYHNMTSVRAVIGVILIVVIGAVLIACSAVLIPYLVDRQIKQVRHSVGFSAFYVLS